MVVSHCTSVPLVSSVYLPTNNHRLLELQPCCVFLSVSGVRMVVRRLQPPSASAMPPTIFRAEEFQDLVVWMVGTGYKKIYVQTIPGE